MPKQTKKDAVEMLGLQRFLKREDTYIVACDRVVVFTLDVKPCGAWFYPGQTATTENDERGVQQEADSWERQKP